MEDPPPLKRPTTRAEPPEDCPVKDRCRRARVQACLDCGEKQKLRRSRRRTVNPPQPPCPPDPQ